MSAARRVGAIVRADVLVRFRRPSTVVVFLALGFTSYLWVPDPASGRSLLSIDGHRALLNSAAIGLATASLGSIFVGLVGFYVVSNALRRDVATRCGAVIAATPVRSVEYLVGKTLGNLVFLATFMLGFMATSMAMVMVRGEAPLEPLVFLSQYLLLVPGSIVLVSVVAIVFESVPWLAGRIGDVVYFFLWLGVLVPGAARSQGAATGAAPDWTAYCDPTAFGFMLARLRSVLGTEQVAIGATAIDPRQIPVVFRGLPLAPEWILPRLVSTLAPLLLLALAVAVFHRFDPARSGRLVARANGGLLQRVQRLLAPLARPIVVLLMGRPRTGRTTLLGAARRDAALTLGAQPAAALAVVAVALIALVPTVEAMRTGLLPAVVALVGVVLADVPCRERQAGTTGLLAAVPRLAPAFVRWKLLTALLVAGLFAAVPLLRLAVADPAALVPLLVGLGFVAAAATAIGVISSNPKAFIVLFLSFWYLVVNDAGHTAAFDFAGFYRAATPAVVAGYGLAGVALYGLAELVYAGRRRRVG